jgi:ubiquinone/menaquinone biosynthesis C-methylase UbiE
MSAKQVVRRILHRLPMLKSAVRMLRSVAQPQAVSDNYRVFDAGASAETVRALEGAWRDNTIPLRQRQLVDKQLQAYRAGEPNEVFDALVTMLSHNVTELNRRSILEVGCSSGYYSEVLSIKGVNASYSGCDYSEAFVDLARKLYPHLRFEVQDAVDLRYGDATFDIVISGGCILHIPQYAKAVAEAARVAGRHVVFHRTPVLHGGGPVTYRKKAYGVETLEIHFNEQQLVRLFRRHGMRVIDINTHAIEWDSKQGDALAMKTYLCEKSHAS